MSTDRNGRDRRRARSIIGWWLSAAAMTAWLLAALPAWAETAADADSDRELARAAVLLEQGAVDGLASRDAAIVVGVSTSVVLIPTGIVLLLRSDDVARIIGAGLTGSAGGALFVFAKSLRRSASERLFESFQTWRASGLSDGDLLRKTESIWAAAAAESAERRVKVGTIETIVGGAFVAAGAALVLSPQLGGFNRHRQYAIGSVLMGGAIPLLSAGFTASMFPHRKKSPGRRTARGRRPLRGR
jgi:hypothetical protein